MPEPTRQTIYQVDAFTTQPFRGNPAAVCVLPKPAPEAWMQAVAREMNLSETAFLVPQADSFHLRWFTPGAEVKLCGHATLASAHILWETGCLPPKAQARFDTLSGRLTAGQVGDWIELNFPARPEQPVEPPAGLLEALGLEQAVYTGLNVMDYLVEVDSEETVRRLTPDFGHLKSLPARGVVVTSRSAAPEYDFVSRFFAPAVGVNEDPVTGSSHCCLGPYWGAKLGKDHLRAYQASARGGEMLVRLQGERVVLSGQAVTVMEGKLSFSSDCLL